MKNQILPMGVTLICLAVMLVWHFLLPLKTLIPPPWNLLGLIPLGCGIAVNLTADGAFHKAGTTVKPFEVSSALITGGVYRLSRNPMYLGFALTLAGVAALLGTLTPWAVVPAFVLLVNRLYIAVEEQMLADRFGPAWRDYRSRVRRWI
ncbi:MAG: isoprenylcysteine carboxylmethyltransferase family protein [Anaerolineales bacterium]|nr:isoprenylcysteine carboxylmethyltransferase family protein [Anaerolineales bacterium]